MVDDGHARRAVYVGLGANLGDPTAQLLAALTALDGLPGVRVLRVSHAWRTPPWGPVAQPPYVNAVAELSTTLEAPSLVAQLLAVERAGGRERGSERWGPRILDLDLLLDGMIETDVPGCHVPHPRLHERAFALVPLAQLCPSALIPGHGRVIDCIAALPAAERAGLHDLGPLEVAQPRHFARRSGVS